MRQPDLDKWIEALESGQYEQGRMSLLDKGHYCCLGVFLDVVATEFGEFNNKDEFVSYDPYANKTHVLPDHIVNHYGFNTDAGHHKDTVKPALVHLNDTRSSFTEIAKVLRDAPEQYINVEQVDV